MLTVTGIFRKRDDGVLVAPIGCLRDRNGHGFISHDAIVGNMRFVLRSKIHRATVTETRLDYEGSITIDSLLLEKSGIWVGEKVLIADVENGNRFDTYVLEGERGSGIIAINGAAAHLCNVGDKIIIMGFELADEPMDANIVLVDEKNSPKGRSALKIYSDGGARGNPGKSAFAVVVTENGKTIEEYSEYLGIKTNNYAEYRGLICAITKALAFKADEAEFVMDSELVIKQMNGEYKVKSPNIGELHDDAVNLAGMIPKVKFTHVKRENPMISRADFLVNQEMDRN